MFFRIFKSIAISGFLTALQCTKFGSARITLREEAYSTPRSSKPSTWFKGCLLWVNNVQKFVLTIVFTHCSFLYYFTTEFFSGKKTFCTQKTNMQHVESILSMALTLYFIKSQLLDIFKRKQIIQIWRWHAIIK